MAKTNPYLNDNRSVMDQFALTDNDDRVSVNVSEQNGSVIVDMDLAGVDLDSIDISVEGNELRVNGYREDISEDEDRDYYMKEIHYGSFERIIPLPTKVDADGAEAELNDGVLTIMLPKIESGHKKTASKPVKSGAKKATSKATTTASNKKADSLKSSSKPNGKKASAKNTAAKSTATKSSAKKTTAKKNTLSKNAPKKSAQSSHKAGKKVGKNAATKNTSAKSAATKSNAKKTATKSSAKKATSKSAAIKALTASRRTAPKGAQASRGARSAARR